MRAEIEAGYAHRNIAGAMSRAGWEEAVQLARCYDPLAPLACQLAFIRAIEATTGWQPSEEVAALREAATALERAQSHLWWLVRFSRFLEAERIAGEAYRPGNALEAGEVWIRPPAEWMLPRNSSTTGGVNPAAVPRLRELVAQAHRFKQPVVADRFLSLRLKGMGVFGQEGLREVGMSGPVLQAAEFGAGDALARLLARAEAIPRSIREAAEHLSRVSSRPGDTGSWQVPAGQEPGEAEGPRGMLQVRVVSAGGPGPEKVEWESPTASLLPLVPAALAGQRLADAQPIIASLDLAMAEVDG